MNAMDNWRSPCVVDIPCPIVVWLRNTFQLDPEARVTKNDVYGMYEDFCHANGYIPKRNSDFGKIMKKAFPEVVSRRLGSAGLQKAHYSGICIKPQFRPQANRNNNTHNNNRSSPPRSPASPSSSLPRTGSPKLRTKTPGSRSRQNSEPISPSSPPPADYEATYHSPPRSSAPSRKRKVRDVSENKEGNNKTDRKSKTARTLDFSKKKQLSPPAVEEEAQPYSLPASLRAAPNIFIQNNFNVNHPSMNPHSSTDAFFSSSSTTLLGPISNLDVRVSASNLPPVEQNEDLQVGNDQSPPLRVKPSKRSTRQLAPLISPLVDKRVKSEAYALPSAGLEEELNEFTELQSFPVSNIQAYCAQSFEAVTPNYDSEQFLDFMQQTDEGDERVEMVQGCLEAFQTKMWPLVPLPAAVFNPLSIEWYTREGRSRSTKLTLYINLSLYFAAVSNNELPQARQLFNVLLGMIPNFYAEQDFSVALVLVMLSSSTFSWLEASQALNRSREFLATAVQMCQRIDPEGHSEVYHMCLDMRSWIESGRETPSLHARFPLHNNDYPPFLLPCRIAIKQCFHLIAMVRHIVYILEHSPSSGPLPECALEDVKEKLALLKACYTNMSDSGVMAGHPFLAKYIKTLLVGSMAELRAVLGHMEKAKVKAMAFAEMVGSLFPFPEVVFYAHRVFDILMANGLREHAKLLVRRFNDQYASLNDVAYFVNTCRNRLADTENNQHIQYIIQQV